MDSDKARELLNDITGEGGSNCCGRAVYELGDAYICSDCKEWCDIEKDEEPKDRAFSYEQLAFIAAREKECKDAGCDDDGHKHD